MKNNRRQFLQKMSIGLGALPFTNLNFTQNPIKKLNVALVGLGRYAGYIADAMQTTQYCRVAALVSGSASKAAEWAKKYNVPNKNIYNYENFDSIKNNPAIDLVYVILPNAMHYEYTIRAAKAGKHVLVEKPMANTAKKCAEMIKVCKDHNVQLGLGYRLHFEPNHKEIMRLGQQKVLGSVKLIEVSLGYHTGDPKEWRLHKKLSGGGPLMNLGVYCIQAARYTLGEEPIAVTAQFGPNTNPELFKDVEASIFWQLEFASGAVATASSCYNGQIDRYYASAEKGSFEMSPAVSYGPFVGKSTEGPFDFPVINQQATQMDEISKILLKGEPLPSHIAGIEGLLDMKVVDAIYKAAKTGKKIKIR